MNELKIIEEIEESLKERFKEIERVAFLNQKKVLDAFREIGVTTSHFVGTSGYGYTDKGRDDFAKVVAKVFGAEDALCSPHLTCGTHTIVNHDKCIWRKLFDFFKNRFHFLNRNRFTVRISS